MRYFFSGWDRCTRQAEALRPAAGAIEARGIGLHPLLPGEHAECGSQNRGCLFVVWDCDAVVHPFAVTPGAHDAGFPHVGEVPRDFGLRLPENLHEITNADFPPVHEVQQTEAGGIGQRRKQDREVEGLVHKTIICDLTNMFRG